MQGVLEAIPRWNPEQPPAYSPGVRRRREWHLFSFALRLCCLRAASKCPDLRHAITKVYENRTQAPCSGCAFDVFNRLCRASPACESLSATAASTPTAGGCYRTAAASTRTARCDRQATVASPRAAGRDCQTSAPGTRTEGCDCPTSTAGPRTASGGCQSAAAIKTAGWSDYSRTGAIRSGAGCRAPFAQRALGQCDHQQSRAAGDPGIYRGPIRRGQTPQEGPQGKILAARFGQESRARRKPPAGLGEETVPGPNHACRSLSSVPTVAS